MLNAEQIIDRVGRLPSLPAAYLRIRQLIDDPRASLQQFAEVISADAAMTARTLAVVNSAFYAMPRRVETITVALTILGMRQVHDIALATTMANTFAGIRPAELDMNRFWHGCVYRGIAARRLARACGLLDAERLFIEGLLSDIGHLILYMQMPEQALAARAAASGGTETLATAERRLIGCDYAQIGATLLVRWKLPPAIEQAVRFHCEPQRAGARSLEAAIVFAGAHLAGAALNELPLPVGAEIPAAVWRTLRASVDVLPEVTAGSDAEAAALTALLFPA